MPSEDSLRSHICSEDLLGEDELVAIVSALIPVGLKRVRLTGGEPTVRRELVRIVERLAGLGLEEVTLSTNGERLVELAEPLRKAGLSRLNISLDSLRHHRFAQLTRHGSLDRVLAGIGAAQAAGFRHIKLNTVALAGFNADELSDICRFAFARDMTPRFIELMPIGEGVACSVGGFLSAAAIRIKLAAELGPLCALDPTLAALPGTGPARYVGVQDGDTLRRIGIIAAVSEPFCDSCDRVRLSASGQLHTCLGYDAAVDLAKALRAAPADCGERSDAVVSAVRRALQDKRVGHSFTAIGCGRPRRLMVAIGG
jgi:cyclic pyranopterin phosphate synthase